MSFLLACAFVAAAWDDAPAISRSYSGVLSDVDGDAQTPVLEFNITCLTSHQAEATQLDFIVVQDAGTALPWHGRFGRQSHRDDGTVEGRAVEIQLTYDSLSVVRDLPPFLMLRDDLAEGLEWTDGSAVYTVIGASSFEGRECWEVEANNRIGYFRTLLIDQTTGALVAAHERVFQGQGDEFALEIVLNSEQERDADAAVRDGAVAQLLLSLQSAVGNAQSAFPDASELNWEESIIELRELSADTSYANLVAGMAREFEQASRLAADVSELASAMVGQPAPEFSVELLGGGESTAESRQGRVVVLHFWEYRDDPLVEPYGQVGYLDFLANQLRDEPVTVLGLAVNGGIVAPETRPAVLRSIRGLKQFMNLGYPIGLDNGDLLESFGDPQSAGADLPLWVVIDADGKVAHYHAGHYEIDVNRGLEQLESEIRELLPTAAP